MTPLEKLTQGEPVAITWHDSGLAIPGWHTLDEARGQLSSMLVSTLGFYLGEASEGVILVAQSESGESFLNVQAIRKEAITSVQSWIRGS